MIVDICFRMWWYMLFYVLCYHVCLLQQQFTCLFDCLLSNLIIPSPLVHERGLEVYKGEIFGLDVWNDPQNVGYSTLKVLGMPYLTSVKFWITWLDFSKENGACPLIFGVLLCHLCYFWKRRDLFRYLQTYIPVEWPGNLWKFQQELISTTFHQGKIERNW